MWKNLGCGICWKPFCGFLVEDEGFNKWDWQCVWSQLTVAPHPLPWHRRNAANVISRYRSNMPSRYRSHPFCLHRADAAEMSSLLSTWRPACIWSRITHLVRSLSHLWCSSWGFLSLTFCLSGSRELLSSRFRCATPPNAGHATSTGMCFLFISTLLTGDSLVKFLVDNFLGQCTLAREFWRLTGI